ncbi:MAG TPA: MMPL family transporter [Pirellulales bacterium]|nr:MMPL family transporter [Pirellulales bacterium]
MKNSFFTRHALGLLMLVTFLLPLVLMGAKLTLRSNRNDVKEWLPASYRETGEYQWFQKNFANETFVLISWDGCTLGDERIKILSEKLMPDAAVPYQGPKLFNRLLTGQTAVDQMTGPPLNLSEAEAISRLRGSLIGPDPKVNQTCVVLTLSKAGKESPRKAVDLIYTTALESGVAKEAIHMGGPPVDNVALDKEGERMLFLLAGLSGLIGLGLSWWYMQNARLVALVLMTSVYGAALSLAIVKFTGNTMDSILLNMPSIVYTMGMSGAIHIINYWRHNAARYGMDGATTRAVKMAWLPCLLSASTTSLGLISLCTSELHPICKFGFYAALGVMSTLTLLYTYVPSALELWGPKVERIDPANPVVPDERERNHRRRMGWIADKICSHQRLVWASFLFVMVVTGYGLTRSSTTVNLMALFSKNSQIVQSYSWLEDHLGPLVPMEIVVRLDEKNCNLSFLDRMELVQQIQRKVEKLKDVGSTLSAATFADIDQAGGKSGSGLGGAGLRLLGGARTRRAVLNKRLAEHRPDFLKGDYLAEDDGQELWRINVRVAALKNVDYGLFVDDIKAVVEPIVQKERAKGYRGIDGVTYTGLTPLVYKAQHSLLSGLITSFCWAFVMIAAVMALNFRSVVAGLLCMIPTVWPVAVVFGMLGWLGIDIDIGTMMTAGVAMGVCVDDTLHYATWFRRALRMGLNRAQATRFAYENAAKAMYQSSFVVGFGLAAFGVSAFMPTRRFGLLMLALLNFGLMADLLLTPAMMAGPLGYFFSKWWIKPKELEAPAAAEAEIAIPEAAKPSDRAGIGAPSSVPAPHVPLRSEPGIIPLSNPTRRRDQAASPPAKRGLGQ